MKKRNLTVALALGAFAMGASGVAFAQATKNLSGSIKIDGSSTVYPITEAVAEEFRKVAPRVRVTVGISGTGGGFKRFTVGETDISDASRPIKSAERDAASANDIEFIEIPVAYDGLSIVVNKNNDWATSMTVDDLKRVFLSGSTVKTWQDINPDWPAVQIKLYAPGTDSGTFDYFKEVVAGKSGSIRNDMQVSEDDNVLVRGVAGDEGAIGFFGAAYYEENKEKVRAVAIDGGSGPVMPEPQYIEDGSYAPFSRPLFIYVNETAAVKPHVRAFVDFYLENAGDMAEEVGYVRLPDSVYRVAKRKWKSRDTGTHWLDDSGNKKTGSVVELYR